MANSKSTQSPTCQRQSAHKLVLTTDYTKDRWSTRSRKTGEQDELWVWLCLSVCFSERRECHQESLNQWPFQIISTTQTQVIPTFINSLQNDLRRLLRRANEDFDNNLELSTLIWLQWLLYFMVRALQLFQILKQSNILCKCPISSL